MENQATTVPNGLTSTPAPVDPVASPVVFKTAVDEASVTTIANAVLTLLTSKEQVTQADGGDSSILTKAGYKTSEAYGHLAATIVNLLILSNVVPTTSVWEKVLGIAATSLSALGYHVLRNQIKIASTK